MIEPFWFEWWKLWAERDYRIPNTDWLVVCASYSSISLLLQYIIPLPKNLLCYGADSRYDVYDVVRVLASVMVFVRVMSPVWVTRPERPKDAKDQS